MEDGCSLDVLLVEERPDVDDKDHNEQNAPAGEGTQTPTETPLVKHEPDTNGADYLSEPIDKVVERARPDIEQSTVEIVKF